VLDRRGPEDARPLAPRYRLKLLMEIEIEPLPIEGDERTPVYRLKRLLKAFLRSRNWECVSAEEVPGSRKPASPQGGNCDRPHPARDRPPRPRKS
jgi:hypothetical protein